MNITLLITTIISLLVGSIATWLYFVKLKKPKNTIDAIESVGASKENDKDREKVKQEILEQIKKNEELRKKIKEKLGG